MIAEDALDLINRQKAEIEKCENIIRFADKTIEKQSAEIERLSKQVELDNEYIESLTKAFNDRTAELQTASLLLKSPAETDHSLCPPPIKRFG